MTNLPKNYDSWRLSSPWDDERDFDGYIAQNFDKYKAIQNVLENCDYDLTEFFTKTDDLWQVFDTVEYHNLIQDDSEDDAILELYNTLNDHIKFRSNYTLTIDDFQGRIK